MLSIKGTDKETTVEEEVLWIKLEEICEHWYILLDVLSGTELPSSNFISVIEQKQEWSDGAGRLSYLTLVYILRQKKSEKRFTVK